MSVDAAPTLLGQRQMKEILHVICASLACTMFNMQYRCIRGVLLGPVLRKYGAKDANQQRADPAVCVGQHVVAWENLFQVLNILTAFDGLLFLHVMAISNAQAKQKVINVRMSDIMGNLAALADQCVSGPIANCPISTGCCRC